MSKNNDTYQQIEDYINGELSPSERLAFENELLTNAGLKEQLELHQVANDLVLESRLGHLSALVNEERIKEKSKKNIQKGMLRIGVILLVSITTYFLSTKNHEESHSTITTSKETIKVADNTLKEVKTKPFIVEEIKPAEPTVSQAKQLPAKTSVSPIVSRDTLSEVIKVITEIKSVPIEVDSKKVVDNKQKMVEPCSGLVLSFNLQFEAVCENTDNGEIKLTSISGGQPPYSTHIKNEYNEVVTNGQLGSGIYNVQVVDKNNCKSDLKSVELIETRCLEDYSISRSYNATLDISAFNEAISFQVLKNNAVYFEKQYNAFEPIKWKGENLNGQVVDGYYLLIVTTESGNKLKGSITILP